MPCLVHECRHIRILYKCFDKLVLEKLVSYLTHSISLGYYFCLSFFAKFFSFTHKHVCHLTVLKTRETVAIYVHLIWYSSLVLSLIF